MKVPGFKSAISDCYSGLPTLCEPPKIKIFGGGGNGAEAIPLFGNILQGIQYNTGSVIDITVTNPGNNYTFPPFVEVVDNCKQGYGAIARATVKDGKINSIYIVSEGENYPVADQPELVINTVNIINPGENYTDGDTVTDNFGNNYNVTIQNGAITKVICNSVSIRIVFTRIYYIHSVDYQFWLISNWIIFSLRDNVN
jgi:hypothetical protein